jgi:predicted nucleic acid-binding protein
MIVIADTSSLCYLILIDRVDVLPRLYGEIIIPEAVYRELQAEEAPVAVRDWIQSEPSWINVASVREGADSELDRLDRGEREAILLAQQSEADLLVLDDKKARVIAINKGIKIIGLLGILRDAAEGGLIDLPSALGDLQKTSFYISPQLIRSLLERSDR